MELELLYGAGEADTVDGSCADVCGTAEEDTGDESSQGVAPRTVPETAADEGADEEAIKSEEPRDTTEGPEDEGNSEEVSGCVL